LGEQPSFILESEWFNWMFERRNSKDYLGFYETGGQDR